MTLSIGLTLGVVEVTVPYFTQQHGHASLAGLLLSLVSVGSIFGALLHSKKRWSWPVSGRLLTGAMTFSLGCAVLGTASSVGMLACLLLVLGLALAPSMIAAYLLATELTPNHRRTETYSWNGSALNAGAAIGAATGGVLTTHAGAGIAFATTGGCSAILVGLASTRLARSRSPDESGAGRGADSLGVVHDSMPADRMREMHTDALAPPKRVPRARQRAPEKSSKPACETDSASEAADDHGA